RRHPLARDLEPVVAAPAVVEEAIGVADVDVACAEPLAHERVARVHPAAPVAEARRGRANVEDALDAVGDPGAVGVEQAGRPSPAPAGRTTPGGSGPAGSRGP